MALAATGLKTHIWNNNLRSIALLVGYPFLLGFIVWVAAAAIGLFMWQGAGYTANYNITYNTARDAIPHTDQVAMAATFANSFVVEYWPIIVTITAIWFVIAWFYSTRMVAMMAHAHPVTRREEPELYNLLENLCIARGITTPHLNIIETDALNAFASGVRPGDYTVTVTRGLINTLQPDEVEGVLAHELAHIINHDVRLLIVCIVFTGMIGFALQLAWSSMRYSLYAPRGGGNNKSGIGLVLVMLVLVVVLALGYAVGLLTRFALSRRREFMADAGAVEMTRNPEAMMRALMRISGKDHLDAVPDDVAMMCIENSHAFLGLFATHPPIDARIQAISTMTQTPVPSLSNTASTDTPNPATDHQTTTPKNPWAR